MKPLPKSSLWLIGITAGAFLVTLLSPQTSWIVRHELQSFESPIPNYTDPTFDRETVEAAGRCPDDVDIQIWRAWMTRLNVQDRSPNSTDGTKLQIDAFHSVEQAFPDSPAVLANVCRAELQMINHYDVECNPQEQAWNDAADSKAAPSRLGASKDTSFEVTDAATDIIRTATKGEMLDPTNAYFPTVLAVAYDAEHDDQTAISCLLSASHDNQWREYLVEQVFGGWKAIKTTDGYLNGVEVTEVNASVLLPEYSAIRSVARSAVWQAAASESGGKIERGEQIRHALMHVGALMRSQSTYAIGSLVGIAVGNLAMRRPGDSSEQSANESSTESSAEHRLWTLRTYVRYLQTHGYTAEAQWVELNDSAGVDARKSISTLPKVMAPYLTRCLADSFFIMVGWLCLSWASCFVLFGCLLKLIEELKCISTTDKSMPSIAAKYIICVLGIALAAGAAANICRSFDLVQQYSSIAWIYDMNDTVNTSDGTAYVFRAIAAGPLAIGGVLLAVRMLSGKNRVVMRIFNGIARALLPLVCGFLIGYCCLVVLQSSEDRVLNQGLSTMVSQGEAQYVAKVSGNEWPGLVPETAEVK